MLNLKFVIEKKVIYFAQGSTGLNSEQKTALQKLYIDMQKLQKLLLFKQNLHQAIRLQIIYVYRLLETRMVLVQSFIIDNLDSNVLRLYITG